MINIFVDINEMLEMHEVTFEIYIEDKLVNKQVMQAPKQMLIANFVQTMEQIIRDRRPMKIRMIKPEIIWDNFENKQKVLDNEISFSNNPMIAWEESKQT